MVDMLLLIGLVVCAHAHLRAKEMLSFPACAVRGTAKFVAVSTLIAAGLLIFTALSLAVRGVKQ